MKCPKCNGTNAYVSKLYKVGLNRIVRVYTCSECGQEIYSFEEVINENKYRDIMSDYATEG